ncbi:MAG: yflS [Gemmatimonadetes bacterium]|nr:yflS [Gemmatimonadota bacterium]
MTAPSLRRKRIARLVTLAIALGIWFAPAPGALTAQAWHLFAIFAATILSVVIGAFSILTASILAIAAAVLSGTLSAEAGYAGFSNPTIILIVVAFLVARAGPSACSGAPPWDSPTASSRWMR